MFAEVSVADGLENVSKSEFYISLISKAKPIQQNNISFGLTKQNLYETIIINTEKENLKCNLTKTITIFWLKFDLYFA